jgi:hypothetical protein
MFNRVRLRLFRMPFEHHAYDRPVSRLVLQPVRPTASGAPVRLLSGPGDSCIPPVKSRGGSTAPGGAVGGKSVDQPDVTWEPIGKIIECFGRIEDRPRQEAVPFSLYVNRHA